MNTPKAFVSYSWDDDSHKEWVAGLATELRNDGVETILDQWHAVPGDQLPAFMLSLGKTMAKGQGVCEIRFDKRKYS